MNPPHFMMVTTVVPLAAQENPGTHTAYLHSLRVVRKVPCRVAPVDMFFVIVMRRTFARRIVSMSPPTRTPIMAHLTDVVRLLPRRVTKLGLPVIYVCRRHSIDAPTFEKEQLRFGTRGLEKAHVRGPFRWVRWLTTGLLGQFKFTIPEYPLTVLFVVLLTARLRTVTLPHVPMSMTREPLLSIKRYRNGNGGGLEIILVLWTKRVTMRFRRRPILTRGTLKVTVSFPVKSIFISNDLSSFGFNAIVIVDSRLPVIFVRRRVVRIIGMTPLRRV